MHDFEERLNRWLQLDELTDEDLRAEILETIELDEQIEFDYLLDSGALDP